MSHTCPACQTENRIGARFCKRCGAPLTDEPATIGAAPPTPADCPACGHPCPPGVRFCSQCGAQVRADAVLGTAVAAAPPDVEAEPAALASRLGGVALGISLALLLIAALFWWMGRDSTDNSAVPAPPAGASAPVASPTAAAPQVARPAMSAASPPITLEVVAEPTVQPPPGAVRAPGNVLPSPVAPAAPSAMALPAASAATGVTGVTGVTGAAPDPSSAQPLRGAAGTASAAAPAPAAPTASAPGAANTPRTADAGPVQNNAPREAPVARAAPAPQRPRPQASPEQACASSNNFTRPFCVSVQCVKSQFRDHPSCVRLREQERQRQELERANGTDG